MIAPDTHRWLKLKTRQLIRACGGLEEASRVCGEDCRAYSVSQLGRCQGADAPDFLPIDIVLCLEAYCGEPMVSAAMAEARPAGPAPAGDVRDELSDVVEGGAHLIRRWREIMADRRLSPSERMEMLIGLDALLSEVRQAQAALKVAT